MAPPRNTRRAPRRRYVQAPPPDHVHEAAEEFGKEISVPTGVGSRFSMRDLKGWLASLLAIKMLPLWVAAANALTFKLDHVQDLRTRCEYFTRVVLEIVLGREGASSQGVDTTLRRQCCMDEEKSSLTFMKVLKAVCAAYDFAAATTKCNLGPWYDINTPSAQFYAVRFDHLVRSLSSVRACVKNDAASQALLRNITGEKWGNTLAEHLHKDHHVLCRVEPGCLLDMECASSYEGQGLRALEYALCKAVVDAAPIDIEEVRVDRSHFSPLAENHPFCVAGLMIPYNIEVARGLVDNALRYSGYNFEGNGLPAPIIRELGIFESVKTLAASSSKVGEIMASFVNLFKFTQPPLLWWPKEQEFDAILAMAGNNNPVALNVWGLMIEHMGMVGRMELGSSRRQALDLYKRAKDCGDLFGCTHVGKMLLEGGDGVKRDVRKAEELLLHAGSKNVKVALSLLAKLYDGEGEPKIARNEMMAAKMYEAAADRGCYTSGLKLADMYELGTHGLHQDKLRAKSIREIALRKQERKMEERSRLGPAVISYFVPEPDHVLCNYTPASDTLLGSSEPNFDIAPELIIPGYEDEVVGQRRFREFQEVDPDGDEFMLSCDVMPKRRRTGDETFQEVWR